MSKNFDDLLSKVSECSKKILSVAVAQDKAVLEAVKAAKERGIADAILVGNEAEIREIGASLSMNMDEYEIINEPDVKGSFSCTRWQGRYVYEGSSGFQDFLKERAEQGSRASYRTASFPCVCI